MLAAFALPATCLQAFVDTNNNGLSDVWEKHFNQGALLDPGFDPSADADHDGWTNAEEAAAGTDPFDPNPPNGMIRPQIDLSPAIFGEESGQTIILTPEAVTVSWPTIRGKEYRLLVSTNLQAGGWTPIDDPISGNDFIQSFHFTTSEETRLFWRVSIAETGLDTDGDGLLDSEEHLFGSSYYSADSDNDGLNDFAEFNAGTSPTSPDTDGDGVSDYDEVLNGQSDPLLAADLDQDGIPDDFEVHFAQQLLNVSSDPVYWGALFAGLQAGDLDPAQDYTQEDITALELHQLLAQSLKGAAAPGGFWLEPWIRTNKFSYAYDIHSPPPGWAEGLFRQSQLDDFDSIETIINPALFTADYLASRIVGAPWIHNLFPYRTEFSPFLVRHFSQSAAGFRSSELPDASGTFHQGHIEQRRFRIVATRPDHGGFSMDCLRVRDETEFWHGPLIDNVWTLPLTLTIPHGKLLSDAVDVAARMGTDKDIAESIIPCDIIVVFGIGPDQVIAGVGTTSRQYFEQYLDSIKLARHGNLWLVSGINGQRFGIKIADNEAALKQALSTPGVTVVFDGHANFGIGPNFSIATHKTIASFTNFGTTGATALPVSYRGIGNEQDVLPYYLGIEPLPPEHSAARDRLAEEGWAYVALAPEEIMGAVTNTPIPHMPGRWKFESDHATSAGATLAKSGSGLTERHFLNVDQAARVIVSAPKSDLPTLRYKTFFYNACSTGPHFIENFQHGEYFFTNRSCADLQATKIFVEGLILGKSNNQILDGLNQPGVGDDEPPFNIYEIKSF